MTLEGSALVSPCCSGLFFYLGFENLQGQHFCSISEQPVSGLGYCQGNFLFPYMQPKPPLFRPMITVTCSHTMQFSEEPGSFFSIITSQVLAGRA